MPKAFERQSLWRMARVRFGTACRVATPLFPAAGGMCARDVMTRESVEAPKQRRLAATSGKRVRTLLQSVAIAALGWPLASAPAAGQPAEPPIETITIIAQKRGTEENIQTVPIAVTALSGVTLEDRHVRTLQDLSTEAPNVTLSVGGTLPGFANFTIRGLGPNSTIPSIEPTVGLFVDGVYLGVSAGVVFDLFDLGDVEILRGPQGLLFGRNTTGGAVLINSRRPGDTVSVRALARYETGPEKSFGLSIEGPLGDKVRVKVAGYLDDDSGWFTNSFDGSEFGKQRVGFVRPMLVFTPVENFDTTAIFEHGFTRGDGAAAQNPAFFSGFNLGIDFRGYNRHDWDSFTLESNRRMAMGVITNVFGWRRLDEEAASDIDSRPVPGFHAFNILRQHQYSDELRLSARLFDRLDVTTGVYYFQQEFDYLERRRLGGGLIDSTMGAHLAQEQRALFGTADYALTREWHLIAGARYSEENKNVHVATFVPSSLGSRCNFQKETCVFNFPGPGFPGAPGSKEWDSFTPKLGVQWQSEGVMAYANWSRGVRSGGYNVRNASFVVPPGPYDPEKQDAYEAGVKTEWLEGRLRANGAVFYNTVKDMQREVNLPDPVVGVVQVTRNTADATIKGFELEVVGAPTADLTLRGSLGYTDGSYDAVFFDLDGGGIGASDLSLRIPRLSKWSYSIGGAYGMTVSQAYLQLRADYGYRSRAAYTDANTTFLATIEDLSASANLTLPDGRWRFSVYGRNLLDKVTEGGVTPLPASVGGGAFRPIAEGRVLGIEASFVY
jgi:iron complex outermembrane receptor protein